MMGGLSTIVIRRRQTVAGGTAHETTVEVTDRRGTAFALRKVLHDAQHDRGRGPWSDADPKVLVGGSVIARLREHDLVEDLVERVLEHLGMA